MGHISTDQLETSLQNLGLLKTEHPPRAGVRLDIIPVISCLVYDWMVKKLMKVFLTLLSTEHCSSLALLK